MISEKDENRSKSTKITKVFYNALKKNGGKMFFTSKCLESRVRFNTLVDYSTGKRNTSSLLAYLLLRNNISDRA